MSDSPEARANLRGGECTVDVVGPVGELVDEVLNAQHWRCRGRRGPCGAVPGLLARPGRLSVVGCPRGIGGGDLGPCRRHGHSTTLRPRRRATADSSTSPAGAQLEPGVAHLDRKVAVPRGHDASRGVAGLGRQLGRHGGVGDPVDSRPAQTAQVGADDRAVAVGVRSSSSV